MSDVGKLTEELRCAHEALQRAQETLAQQRAEIIRLREYGAHWAQRAADLEREGAAALLLHERDMWRDRWRKATRRIGVLLERGADAEAAYKHGYARESASIEDE